MRVRYVLIETVFLGVMLVWGLPTALQAQLIYATNNGAITITGYTGNLTVLNIPSSINGYPVTTIGTNAFLSRLTLTSVTISDSVTNIAKFAFDQCSGMTNISFGNGVTTIGVGAFIQCLGLTSVTVPDSVTSIGDQAFSNCQNITNFIFGSGVATIGSGALNNCLKLKIITVPTNVTTIGGSAFQNCTGVTNIIIGSGVTNIGPNTLTGCTSLTTTTIGMPIIGNLFSWVGGASTFPALTRITLLDSVTNIGNYAFSQCGNLTNISIGSGLQSIGTGAFLGLIALKTIAVVPSNTSYSSINGILFDASQSTLIQFPCGVGGIYTVPISVTNIGSSAFAGCIYLRNIYFMGNAPSYGASAFSYDTATVYYLPGTTGWGTTFGGLPTALWLPLMPTNDGTFGVQTNGFGFNINWASAQAVVVEASTDLINWLPVQTNTLTTGTAYFNDQQWTNYPTRFYRLRSP